MSNFLKEIKKSVSFIFIKNNKGDLVANGTGFFVSVKNEKNNERYNVYFVTAKHVLQNKNGEYLKEITLRLNKKDDNSQLIQIDLTKIKIFEHNDKEIDIAVFDCLPDQEVFDFKCIQDQLIASSKVMEENEISEGDDVFFAGLFTSYIGQKKNQPIIRFGKVSLMSDEKIEWKESNKPARFLDLYLLECQSFGGNSGSPVFFNLNPMRKLGQLSLGGPAIFLAGLMMGSFFNGSEVLTNNVAKMISLQNIGIAAITPAYKLHEILFSEELIKLRNN